MIETKKVPLMLLIVLALPSLWAQNIPAGLEYDIVGGRSVTITGYTGDATTLNIPAQIQGFPVTAIGDYAFSAFNESLLEVINIPSSITSIGEGVFDIWWSCLTSITVDSSNPFFSSIDGVLFNSGGTLLTYPNGRNDSAYTIPALVTSIDDGAFYNNYSLTSITIPSSVTSVGYGTFYWCHALTSIIVDNSNPAYTSIDGVLFDKNIRSIIRYPKNKTARYYSIPSSVISIGNLAFSECRSLTNITIPSSVWFIGDFAFNDSGLTSITIPSSVTSIGNGAFDACNVLTDITVDSRNPFYTSVDGVLFDKSMQTIIRYPLGKTASAYTIPSSVTYISDRAFSWSDLTSVTVPSSLTSIGDYAFYCSGLTSITVPSWVTYIGIYVFSGCSDMTSVTISRRTQVGEGAFPETARIIYSD